MSTNLADILSRSIPRPDFSYGSTVTNEHLCPTQIKAIFGVSQVCDESPLSGEYY